MGEVIDDLVEARRGDITFVHFRDEFLTDGRENLLAFFEEYEAKVNLPFWAYLVPQQVVQNPEIAEARPEISMFSSMLRKMIFSNAITMTLSARCLSPLHKLH